MVKQTKLFGEKEVETVEKLELKVAEDIAINILTMVDGWCKKIEVVGSIRRQRKEVHDIDFVVLPYNLVHWRKIKETMLVWMDAKVVAAGDQIMRFLVKPSPNSMKYVQVDFYGAKPETYGIYKLVRTGSMEHNIWLAKHAIRKGMRLRYSVGLESADKDITVGATEEAIFDKLKLPFIEPKLREMSGLKPVWWKDSKVTI